MCRTKTTSTPTSTAPSQSYTVPRHHRFSAQLCCPAMPTSLASPLAGVAPVLVEERYSSLLLLAIGAFDQPAHFVLSYRLAIGQPEHDVQKNSPKREQLGKDDVLRRCRAISFREVEDGAPAPL